MKNIMAHTPIQYTFNSSESYYILLIIMIILIGMSIVIYFSILKPIRLKEYELVNKIDTIYLETMELLYECSEFPSLIFDKQNKLLLCNYEARKLFSIDNTQTKDFHTLFPDVKVNTNEILDSLKEIHFILQWYNRKYVCVATATDNFNKVQVFCKEVTSQ